MEKVMQYMWQWRLYGSPDRRLTDGRLARIVHPGQLNKNSGPDFFNAKIMLDGTEWAGNVELHVKASDWLRHGHHLDPAYDSVILHVVGDNDTYVRRRDGSLIPQLHLPFSAETAARYAVLASQQSPLRCRAYIAEVPAIFLHDAMDSCAMERLQEKADRVTRTLHRCNGDWRHTTFIVLARALGFGINAVPFEMLAANINPNIAARHSDSLFQLEALLMGAAGLLDRPGLREDDYLRALRTEHEFLAHKYNLTSLDPSIWKFAGSRPAASPLRRCAYLALVLARTESLLGSILDAGGDLPRLRALFQLRHEGYWLNHLTFGAPTARPYADALGAAPLDILLLNTVAPLYYAYGESTGDTRLTEQAQELQLALPAEVNSVTRLWTGTTSVSPANAWETQGLLQLTRKYCEPGNCLRCRIALRALRKSSTKP